MRNYIVLGLSIIMGAALFVPISASGAVAAPLGALSKPSAVQSDMVNVHRRRYRHSHRRRFRSRNYRRYRAPSYSACRWLRQRAQITGRRYWLRRFRRCVRLYH